MASRWTQEYAYPTGNFYVNVKSLLQDIPVDWDDYFSTRPLWITEFKCNNDNVKGSYCPRPLTEECSAELLGSHEEQCTRITGNAEPPWQSHPGWGEGVFR